MNLLFTNAGRRTYLIEYALQLNSKGYAVRVFASDNHPATAAFWVPGLAGYFLTPWVSDSEEHYATVLLHICLENKIDCIIPLMDYELPVLARHRSIFKKNGITVVISDRSFIENTLNKKQFYSFCQNHHIPTPRTYFTVKDAPDGRALIRKKIVGSAGIGLTMHKSKADLANFQENSEIIQDFVEAPEYGMDILNDLEGNFLHASFRQKLAMRSGETDKATVFFSEPLTRLARSISEKCRHIGNLDVDFFMNQAGEVWVVDFNPRFGGGYPFTHLAGFDYIQYIVDQLLGNPVQIPSQGRAITGMKGIQMYLTDEYLSI